MIPIVINNFNRLTTTRKMVDDLVRLGYFSIHIIDNNSTYSELLKWYDILKRENSPIQVHRLEENLGQLALYNSGIINDFRSYPYIVYTDPDIELNQKLQAGFIESMIHTMNVHDAKKCGLALQIHNLPDTEFGWKIFNHEVKYWAKEIAPGVFDADVDTTFCIISPKLPFDYKAIRIAGDFTAKHIPWYTDFSNLDVEESYIIDHLDSRYSTYKGHILQMKIEKE